MYPNNTALLLNIFFIDIQDIETYKKRKVRNLVMVINKSYS